MLVFEHPRLLCLCINYIFPDEPIYKYANLTLYCTAAQKVTLDPIILRRIWSKCNCDSRA